MWPGIASRGPNGRGELAIPRVGLLHSRLAVIDLATGDQPIWNEARSVACVFNGEIYNYRELRAQLLARGHTLTTTSDTEVLVHLYEDLGPDLLGQIRGMYAFAILDQRQQTLFVARDRLGIKPLYHSRLRGGFAFASAIDSLLALNVSRDPDPQAVAEYLQFNKVGEPRTAYREVQALRPGHFAMVKLEGTPRLEEMPFFELPSPARKSTSKVDVDESIAEARAALERSVKRHLVADVEVGAFLSGGIDSSLVTALAQRSASRPLRTFSIGFKGHGKLDESSFAEEVARKLGTNHETFDFSSPPLELLRGALSAAQQPFAIASFLPLLVLSKQAAKSVRVVLTGDGGDEVGLGYSWYRWAKYSRQAGWPSPPPGAVRAILAMERRVSQYAKLRPVRRALRFARGAVVGGPRASDAWRYDLTSADALQLLREEHRPQASASSASPTERSWDWSLASPEALRSADLSVLLRDEMLPKLDRAGMAFGLEGRVPLLDDDFVAAMMRVPISAHMEHRFGKSLLRRWLGEVMPGVDFERPKHGFDVPIASWLNESLAPELDRLILNPSKPGLTRPAANRELRARAKAGVPGAAHSLYAVLMVELWFEGTQQAHA
jgi:asparagine synthase (glutamine-hydrolysing)